MNSNLHDSFQRTINYLRLSVTDRCNLRCSYCMPKEGAPLCSQAELLTRSQIKIIAEVATTLGIQKIRVTGGEPLVRPDIVDVLGDLGSLPGLKQLVLTTNGLRLASLAEELKALGIVGTNISIDSLNPDLYRSITRGGDLKHCLAGIEAALKAGLKTKLNVVILAGVNDHEIGAFVEMARTRPLAVRFIEYMPTRGNEPATSLTLPSAQILERIQAEVPLEPVEPAEGLTLAGPAREYRLPGGLGSLGFISAITDHFCGDCNRIRITADGLARGCLFHETGLDLKPWLLAEDRAGLTNALCQVVRDKPERHRIGKDDGPEPVAMSRMGG